MKKKLPSLVFAGLSGGTGKTLCTLSVVAALRKRHYRVACFKKGPDFIDRAWLSKLSDGQCRNLDVFLFGEEQSKRSFLSNSYNTDIAIVEGNRGLFDGFDKRGSYSTANLAKLLSTKIILIINCTKMTNSIAAIVTGCQNFDPLVKIAGVILNRIAGKRHETILRDSLQYHTAIPVIGAIPKLKNISIFERHLGLLPPQEHDEADKVKQEMEKISDSFLDIETLLDIAQNEPNPPLDLPPDTLYIQSKTKKQFLKVKKKVGVIQDKAFNFYYPENIESLEKNIGEIVYINAITDTTLPAVDMLYIGGGFPETHAKLLARNKPFMISLKRAVEKGLPVYAECGGLVYLGKSLTYGNKCFEMSGILPVDFHFKPKPMGHGYTVVTIIKPNPFYEVGTVLRGHEFHYTYPKNADILEFVGEVQRGYGFDGKNDCAVYKNVFAAYMHIHAYSLKNWGAIFNLIKK